MKDGASAEAVALIVLLVFTGLAATTFVENLREMLDGACRGARRRCCGARSRRCGAARRWAPRRR